jgi:hypothetical protein
LVSSFLDISLPLLPREILSLTRPGPIKNESQQLSGKEKKIERGNSAASTPGLETKQGVCAEGDPPPLKTMGADWRSVYSTLVSAVKARHNSPKTLKASKDWIHHFQTFVKRKDPQHIELSDVKEFLSFPAVQHNASASSRNQAKVKEASSPLDF